MAVSWPLWTMPWNAPTPRSPATMTQRCVRGGLLRATAVVMYAMIPTRRTAPALNVESVLTAAVINPVRQRTREAFSRSFQGSKSSLRRRAMVNTAWDVHSPLIVRPVLPRSDARAPTQGDAEAEVGCAYRSEQMPFKGRDGDRGEDEPVEGCWPSRPGGE